MTKRWGQPGWGTSVWMWALERGKKKERHGEGSVFLIKYTTFHVLINGCAGLHTSSVSVLTRCQRIRIWPNLIHKTFNVYWIIYLNCLTSSDFLPLIFQKSICHVEPHEPLNESNSQDIPHCNTGQEPTNIWRLSSVQRCNRHPSVKWLQ